MGNCIFCGQKVSIFRSKHKECENKFIESKNTISNIIHDCFIYDRTKSQDLKTYTESIDVICKEGFIDTNTKKTLIISGVEKSIETAFDDGLLSEEEENSLNNLIEHYNLSQIDFNTNGYFTKLKQGTILRKVMNGIMPKDINIDGQLPFNFQKKESLIWVEQNVRYLETTTKSRFVGGSHGISVRVAKGLYYRAGAFKGERISTNETKHADTGLLAITNKHIYFGGSIKNFRVSFDKIVSFMPYSDGFGIQKDSATAKPQAFITGDSWFIYNLLSNISNLEE